VEQQLAEMKQEETALEPCVKELADTNHLLVELDADYAARTRETGTRRNTEIQRPTSNVQNLEAELERVKAMKTSFIGGLSKKAKAQKIAEATSKLEAAKVELEKAIESFRADQEKLHDDYEKKKQVAIAKVQLLEKEIEKLENDKSLNARQEASENLGKAVKALLDRQPKTSPAPAE
jgi:DNA repair exonuclease SbcCD ATPase subunit